MATSFHTMTFNALCAVENIVHDLTHKALAVYEDEINPQLLRFVDEVSNELFEASAERNQVIFAVRPRTMTELRQLPSL